jgi:protocatechuate 3,4-dioxygenase beta subunit
MNAIPLNRLRPAFVGLWALLISLLLSAQTGHAQSASLTKSLAAGTPNPIPAGEDFDYVIGYTFSSTTADFYSATVTDVLPAGLVYAGSFTPSAHVVSVDTPPDGSGGTVTFNMISPLPAGSSGTLKIRVRFPLGTTADGTSAVNTVSGSGNYGSPGGPLVSGSSGPVSITASAGCSWVADISGPTSAVLGQNVTNTVGLYRPAPVTGNLNILTGSFLTNVLPVGVLPSDIVSAGTGATTNGTGLAGDPVRLVWSIPATVAAGADGSAVFTRNVVLRYSPFRFTNPQDVTPTVTAGLNLFGATTCAPTDSLTTTVSGSPDATVSKTVVPATVPTNTLMAWHLSATNTGTVALDSFTLNDPLPQSFALSSIQLPTVANGPGGNFITVRYATSADPTLQAWSGSPFAAGTTVLPVSALGLAPGVYVSRVQFEFGTVGVGFGLTSTIRLNGSLLSTGWGVSPPTLVPGSVVPNTNRLTASFAGNPAFPEKTAEANVTVDADAPAATITKGRNPASNIATNQSFAYTLAALNTGNVVITNLTLDDSFPQNFVLTSIRLPAMLNGPGGNYITLRYATTTDPSLQVWGGSPFNGTAATNLPVSALGLLAGDYVSRVVIEFATAPLGFSTQTGTSAILYNGTLVSPGWGTPPRTLVGNNTVTNIVSLTGSTRAGGVVGAGTNIITVSTSAATTNATVSKGRSVASVTPNTQTFNWTITAASSGNQPMTAFTLDDLLPQNFALQSVRLPTANNGPAGDFITVRYATSANAALQVWPGGPFPAASNTLPVTALGLASGVYVSRVVVEFGDVPSNFGLSTSPNNPLWLTGVLLSPGWFDGAELNEGDSVTNAVTLTASGITRASTNNITALAGVAGGIGKGTSSATATVNGSSVYWTLVATNRSNVSLDDFTLYDPIPGHFNLTSIRRPVWTPTDTGVQLGIRYVRSDDGTTNIWPGGPFSSGTTTMNVSDLGLPAGVRIAAVFFDFGTVPASWRISTAARLTGTFISPAWDNPASAIQTSTSICNTGTLTATLAGDPAFPPRTSGACITVAPAVVSPASAKSITSGGSLVPGSEITYRVETANSSAAGIAMVNPMAMDLLPAEVEYVGGSFTFLTGPVNNTANATQPTLEVVPDYDGTGRLLLRWSYTNAFATNTFSAVSFKARVKAGTANGTAVNNTSYVFVNPSQQWGTVTYPNPSGPDINDLNGNGNTTEQFGQSAASSATVAASASLQSSKFVRGALDTEYSRFPAFGFTVPGGSVDYRIVLFNNGSVNVTNILLLDILPAIGDTGVIDLSPRGSQWTPLLTAPIDVLVNGLPVPGTTVEYSTETNPCRPEAVPSGPPGCAAPGWSTTPPVPISQTRSFRVIFPPEYELAAGSFMTVDISMVAPFAFIPGSISWNSFAYRATPASPGLPDLFAEPIKVGVSAIPPYSVGDYVWLDENSDGYQDAGEPGIPNVRVNLYNLQGTLIDSTLTDAHGRYLFSGLIIDLGYVHVDETTLPPGMTQTPPSNLPDANFGNQDQSTGPADYGYFVKMITGIPNLTADFGYNWNPAADVLTPAGSPVAALGDRVWLDLNGNGRQDPDELGVSGATAQLFTAGPDGLFGTSDDVPGATRVTDANGNYMFDDLPPGAYIVRVVSDAGASYPILGTDYSQTGDPDHFGFPGANNDHQTTIPIVLGPGDVFLNADFGYQPNFGVTLGQLGALVWLDINSSSNNVPDSPSERGIAGVTVGLIRDTNGNGAWDAGEPIIATTTTQADGLYLFQGLPLSDEGDGDASDADYLVWVNDTADNLANLVPTYDNLGLPNSLGRATLSAGTPLDFTLNFSYKPMTQPGTPAVTIAVLGDQVWFDANRNGLMDSDESGIPGVLMELLDAAGNVIFLAVTDPAGYYYFAGLDPSATYSVRVAAANFLPGQVLAGLENTFDPDGGLGDQATVNFAVNDGPSDPDGTRNRINLGQDFGYGAPAGPAGSLGNQLWVDSNADGIRDPSGADGLPGTDDDEPALAGITVDLYRDLNLNGLADAGEPRIATTITDANGQYLFTGLPLADGLFDPQFYGSDPDAAYVVDVSDRSGILAGWWHSLGNQSPASNDTSKTDPWAVTLTETVPEVLTADFGYYVEPAAVGNFVWEDLNGNGLQDPGEPGIDGVLMQLQITYPDGTITVLKTITGDNLDTPDVEAGWYRFSNLLQDEHYNGVNMTPTPTFETSVLTPAGTGPLTGLAVTLLNQGSNPLVDADDPDGTAGFPIKGITDMQPFASPNDQPQPAGYDFGYVRTLALGNLVWLDTNNNGVRDADEVGSAGVKIELLAADNGLVLDTTFTDANGYYRFDGLFPGEYQVRIAADNWTGITDSPGGALDGTKPLAQANSSTGNATAAQTSGPDAVNNLDHGVDSATPASTGITSLTVTLGPGNQPLNDKDADATGAGDHGLNGDAYDNLALDFGFYRLSVGNLVFADQNLDGIFNAGDAGLDGVIVQLWSGATLVAVTTTSGGGLYQFAGPTDADGVLTGNPLLPGTDYTVTLPGSQAVLANFYSTLDTAGTPNPNGGVDNDDNVVGGAPATGSLSTPVCTLAAGAGAPNGVIVTAGNGLTDQPTIDVGLAPASALVALGNLIWLDTNADGKRDAGEAAITGVTVQLFAAGADPGVDVPVRTTTTDADGRYYFDALPPGGYFAFIPASSFQSGGPLTNLLSSPGAGSDAAIDENADENGLDASTPATTGIRTGTFTLSPGTGPLGESAQNYTGSVPDANTTFTVDFGFTPTYSLGNRVFADNGVGGGTANNGLQDGTEPGIAGVQVVLFAADGSANPTGAALGTQTTDASGWYRFDGLLPGTYVVVVDVAGSGTVLADLMNSSGISTNFNLANDLRDHGHDQPMGTGTVLPGGIASAAVTLGTGLQPTGEATGPGAGANGPTGDAGDNLVADFGFTCATYVDGYVFEDFTRDGRWVPGSDVPLSGITVWITNSQGTEFSVVTDATGYFRAYVPAGNTAVLVDTSGLPPGFVLTDNTFGQGENPSTVSVPFCGSARDNTGFRDPAPTLASVLGLTAHTETGAVTVQWVTLGEFGTVAFQLERQLPGGAWTTVNEYPLFALNSAIGGTYAVVDAGARPRQTYYYRLVEFLDSGATRIHGPFAVTVEGDPGLPVPVTGVTVADGQLRLTWAGGATTYYVERSPSLGADALWLEVPLPSPDATEVLVPLEGATGFFRVFRIE